MLSRWTFPLPSVLMKTVTHNVVSLGEKSFYIFQRNAKDHLLAHFSGGN
jgi:hypothetical protein